MKMSLIPITLSLAEFEAVAAAADLQGSTVGEFIVRISLAEARCASQTPPRDRVTRDRPRPPQSVHPPLPPDR
jgi:hypothetical protein